MVFNGDFFAQTLLGPVSCFLSSLDSKAYKDMGLEAR